MMKVTVKRDMLALHGVVRLVNSCHINIAHKNVECSTQAYNAGAEPATVYIGAPWRSPPLGLGFAPLLFKMHEIWSVGSQENY